MLHKIRHAPGEVVGDRSTAEVENELLEIWSDVKRLEASEGEVTGRAGGASRPGQQVITRRPSQAATGVLAGGTGEEPSGAPLEDNAEDGPGRQEKVGILAKVRGRPESSCVQPTRRTEHSNRRRCPFLFLLTCAVPQIS